MGSTSDRGGNASQNVSCDVAQPSGADKYAVRVQPLCFVHKDMSGVAWHGSDIGAEPGFAQSFGRLLAELQDPVVLELLFLLRQFYDWRDQTPYRRGRDAVIRADYGDATTRRPSPIRHMSDSGVGAGRAVESNDDSHAGRMPVISPRMMCGPRNPYGTTRLSNDLLGHAAKHQACHRGSAMR